MTCDHVSPRSSAKRRSMQTFFKEPRRKGEDPGNKVGFGVAGEKGLVAISKSAVVNI